LVLKALRTAAATESFAIAEGFFIDDRAALTVDFAATNASDTDQFVEADMPTASAIIVIAL
jgi:hypothetical protein